MGMFVVIIDSIKHHVFKGHFFTRSEWKRFARLHQVSERVAAIDRPQCGC
jgi:hypothetical protein